MQQSVSLNCFKWWHLCCLVSSHYLNQCYIALNWTIEDTIQWFNFCVKSVHFHIIPCSEQLTWYFIYISYPAINILIHNMLISLNSLGMSSDIHLLVDSSADWFDAINFALTFSYVKTCQLHVLAAVSWNFTWRVYEIESAWQLGLLMTQYGSSKSALPHCVSFTLKCGTFFKHYFEWCDLEPLVLIWFNFNPSTDK